MAFADTQKLVVELDLKGNLNAKLGEAARALKGFDRATSNTQQSLSKFGRNLERGVVLGATAAAGGFIAVAKAAGDFQAQMNTIATIVDRKDIAQIGDQLRKTARETGVGLEDLTSAYYDLASAGVKGKLATDALNDAVKLGIGGLATTAETVDLLTTAINAYGLDSAGAAKATDQFAQAVADGKVKASEIAATFADVASIAKTYKIGIDQIAASYAYLTAQGVPAGEVTTEMQRAIISLIKPTKELEDAQKKLKINFTQEIAKKGLVGALEELRVYSDKTGIPLIALLGRIEAVKYTLQTTGDNFKPFNAELAKMGNVSGVAAAQMAERQQGLNYQLAILKANIKDAAITIGSALLPKLTPLVKKLSDFIQLGSTQANIKDFAAKLADGFEKFADALQKVDWQPFIDGLKLSADIAKTVISAFRSMPEDLQKLVVAGFALNKISGGLGTSIVKDLGGALINNFAQRGSSPANPVFVSDIGGGIGGAAGKGGGLLGTAANFVMKVAVVGMVAEVADLIHSAISPGGGLEGRTQTNSLLPADQLSWPFGPKNTPHVDLGPFHNIFGGDSAFTAPVGGHDTHDVITTSGRGASANAREDRGALHADLGALGGKLLDDLGGLKDTMKGVGAEFTGAVKQLAHPKSQAELVHAAQATLKMLQAGRGDLGNTTLAIKTLQAKLKDVHDPKTKAALEAQLRKVEGLLPGRQFAANELSAAKKILSSHESGNKKISDLKRIEQQLKDHSLPHAAAVIHQKINAEIRNAKKATDYARRAIVEEVKDKDLSVTLNNAVSVNNRQIISAHKTYVLSGNVVLKSGVGVN